MIQVQAVGRCNIQDVARAVFLLRPYVGLPSYHNEERGLHYAIVRSLI